MEIKALLYLQKYPVLLLWYHEIESIFEHYLAGAKVKSDYHLLENNYQYLTLDKF